MLLVAITCTDKDFEINSLRMRISIENFISIFGSDVFFLFVFQSKCPRSSPQNDFSFLPATQYELVLTSYFSVSRARNYALIFAKKMRFTKIIFHDSSLIYTSTYLSWIKLRKSVKILSTKFCFSDSVDVEASSVSESNVTFDVFDNGFVCSYVFSMDADLPYFDERFGPGEESFYSSGEDFLFLREFFKKNPFLKDLARFDGVGILHPPRHSDYSKHLAYAEGQGKIHQIILLEDKNLYAVWRSFLFFGNAIFRTISFKENSLKILVRRIKGFLDCKVKA
jgi:hypothetical protein